MNPPKPKPDYSFIYFALGVLCVAVLLGGWFMRFNAQVDQAREEAAVRLALCQHFDNVARAAAPEGLESSEECRQLRKRYAD